MFKANITESRVTVDCRAKICYDKRTGLLGMPHNITDDVTQDDVIHAYCRRP